MTSNIRQCNAVFFGQTEVNLKQSIVFDPAFDPRSVNQGNRSNTDSSHRLLTLSNRQLSLENRGSRSETSRASARARQLTARSSGKRTVLNRLGRDRRLRSPND
jgi:hypothetical protein